MFLGFQIDFSYMINQWNKVIYTFKICGIIHIFFFFNSSNSGSNYNSININSWPIDVVEIVPVRNFVLTPEPQYKQQCQCFHWFRISKKREKKNVYVDQWNRKESPPKTTNIWVTLWQGRQNHRGQERWSL